MAKKKPQVEEIEEPSLQVECASFSGVARSVQCYSHQGFRDFRIVTLHLKNGTVDKIEYSDPYANFETISRMELQNEIAIHHLNNHWKNGRTLSK